MEEVKKSNAGQGLGIAGFVLGVIALVVSLIPCIGLLALVLSITGIVLSAVALTQASKGNGPRGLIMAALVISILATVIALTWNIFIVDKIKHGANQIEKTIENEVGKEAEQATGEFGKGMEQALKELEEGTSTKVDSLSEQDFDKLLSDYQNVLKEYVKLADKAQKGDVSSVASFTRVAAKTAAVTAKLAAASMKLTDAQREKFEELQKQYEEALAKVQKK